jgi:hypothetical protein
MAEVVACVLRPLLGIILLPVLRAGCYTRTSEPLPRLRYTFGPFGVIQAPPP